MRSDASELQLAGQTRGKSNEAFSRSVGLLESCLSDTAGISQLLHDARSLAAAVVTRASQGKANRRAARTRLRGRPPNRE